MIEIRSKLRKWGNSFGIVVPQKIIEKENAKEGDDISIFISTKKTNLRNLSGKHKFKRSIEEEMKEIDEDLYND